MKFFAIDKCVFYADADEYINKSDLKDIFQEDEYISKDSYRVQVLLTDNNNIATDDYITNNTVNIVEYNNSILYYDRQNVRYLCEWWMFDRIAKKISKIQEDEDSECMVLYAIDKPALYELLYSLPIAGYYKDEADSDSLIKIEGVGKKSQELADRIIRAWYGEA